MNYNPLCVYDYETGDKDRDSCQIIEIAAVMIHSRKLEIVDRFKMMVRPNWEEPGITEETIEWHAEQRKITKKEMISKLENAPSAEIAWPTFVSWVDRYNYGKPAPNGFKAPVPCGFNTSGFDNIITDRYCEKYGPTEKSKHLEKKVPRLFNRVTDFDLYKHLWFWFENIPTGKNEELENLKLGTIAKYMGIPEDFVDKAHEADIDVFIAAQILIKLFKAQRYLTSFSPQSEEDEKLGVKLRRRLEMQNTFVDKFPSMC